MLFYGVVSDFLDEAVELFPTRAEADAVVEAWDRDEPNQAGAPAPRADRARNVAELGRGTPSHDRVNGISVIANPLLERRTRSCNCRPKDVEKQVDSPGGGLQGIVGGC